MSYRRSIRLPDYDYAQQGAYFITICIQHHEHRLGHIANDEMHRSPAGEMVTAWWQKLPEKFPDIELGEYVVMPNHFHGIIINVGVTTRSRPQDNSQNDVGATPRGRPQDDSQNDVGATPRSRPQDDSQNDVGATPRGRPTDEVRCHNMMHIDLGDPVGLDMARDLGDPVGLDMARDLGDPVGLDMARDLGDHVGSPLRDIVGWFKIMTTNDYIRNVKHNGWPRFDKRLWQRNYYEHIIRTDRAFKNITTYIMENPQRWRSDRLFS